MASVSVDGLNAQDPGLELLAQAVSGVAPDELLLVHCGDLPGIAPGARRLILDVRERVGSPHRCLPVGLQPPWAELNGVRHAALWPRAHLGKDFAQASVALAARVLQPGGILWCSIRKRKGADSLIRVIEAVMGGAEVVARERGYRLIRAQRGERIDGARAEVLLGRRYRFGDPLLGSLQLEAAPGVFSRRALDRGTRALLLHLQSMFDGTGPSPTWVLDLGAGVGPLSLWAASRFPEARVLAVDTNYVAADLLRRNAAEAGVEPRIEVAVHDGLPAAPKGAPWEAAHGRIGLAVSNPPTHLRPQQLQALIGGVRPYLEAGAPAVFVASRAPQVLQALQALGAQTRAAAHPGYTVIEARWPGA